MPKVALHTLGCKLNFSETSAIGKQFLRNGFEIVDFNNVADVYVLNTCTVTENAEKDCRQLIRHTLKKNPDAYIIITGCYAQLKPNENLAASGSPQGLSLERSFYRLKPSSTTSDGKIHFRSDQITDNTIQAGETVLMKIKVNAPISLPYTLLEVYLPSGAEVVQHQAKEDLVEGDNTESGLAGDWSAPWWSHQDILDDRIVFFSTNLPQGKSEFSTLVRMEMPGHYQINPIRVEGMYTKNVRAYSNLDTIKVTK